MKKISDKILILALLSVLTVGIYIVRADDENSDSGERDKVAQPAVEDNTASPLPEVIPSQTPSQTPIRTPSRTITPDHNSTSANNNNSAITTQLFGVEDANRNGIDDKYENLR